MIQRYSFDKNAPGMFTRGKRRGGWVKYADHIKAMEDLKARLTGRSAPPDDDEAKQVEARLARTWGA